MQMWRGEATRTLGASARTWNADMREERIRHDGWSASMEANHNGVHRGVMDNGRACRRNPRGPRGSMGGVEWQSDVLHIRACNLTGSRTSRSSQIEARFRVITIGMSFVGFGSYNLGDDENNNAVATCRLLANALPFRSLGSTHSAGSWLIVRSTPLGLGLLRNSRVHSLVAVAKCGECCLSSRMPSPPGPTWQSAQSSGS